MVFTVLYYKNSHIFSPPNHPMFGDNPYKRPFMGGTVGGLLGEVPQYYQGNYLQ
jgi:hypothetical protein